VRLTIPWGGDVIHDAVSFAKMEDLILHDCGFLLFQKFPVVKSALLFHTLCQASIVVQSW
jgi:hypothetical protein